MDITYVLSKELQCVHKTILYSFALYINDYAHIEKKQTTTTKIEKMIYRKIIMKCIIIASQHTQNSVYMSWFAFVLINERNCSLEKVNSIVFFNHLNSKTYKLLDKGQGLIKKLKCYIIVDKKLKKN